MKDIKEYFETEEDYKIFHDALCGQLNGILMPGEKLNSRNPVVREGAAIIIAPQFKSLPKTKYWITITQMASASLD